MDKMFLGLFDNIVSFLKEYGVLGLVLLFVTLHLIGMFVPSLPFDTPTSSSAIIVILLSFFYYVKKWFNAGQDTKSTEIADVQNKLVQHEEKLEEISTSLITLGKQSEDMQERLEKISEGKKKTEVQLMERKEANHIITESLLKLQRDARADRTFVLEFHNGTHNNAKLDFAYASMQYEEYTDGLDSVSDVFQRMSTSLFKYLDYMIDHCVFFGDMNAVAQIDPKLAVRMRNNGTLYGGCMLLKSGGKMMGVLGVTYVKEPKYDGETIKDIMNKYATDIADALAMKKKEKDVE